MVSRRGIGIGLGLVMVLMYVGQAPAIAGVLSGPAMQTAYATVTKQHGAALRGTPSSEGSLNVLFTAGCGEVFTVTGRSNGWLQVAVPPGRYASPEWSPADGAWIGGSRVEVSASPMNLDCSDAVVFPILSSVTAQVEQGCLSLRHTPSRSAGFDQCVPTGTLFFIVNGPIEVDDEDWFQVTSLTRTAQGTGWVRAEFLRAAG
ncbi:MAG: hypothetical protein ACKVVP_03255 [Chloroflexota bacterium]